MWQNTDVRSVFILRGKSRQADIFKLLDLNQEFTPFPALANTVSVATGVLSKDNIYLGCECSSYPAA